MKKTLETELAAIRLAEETLEQISAELYEECGEHFYKRLSEYVSAFTDGAYVRLTADENLKLCAITNDRTVEVAEVSRGTGEQFYMALRFAAADVLDPEKKNPMILDDSFAFFDEQRLESALLALSRSGRQVILFSSTGREERMLQRMGVPYTGIWKEQTANEMK